MKVALLGGAFNPPHIGHTLIAQQVLDYTDIKEVWFLPNYHQSPPKPVAEAGHRVNMTKLINFLQTRVSLIEIDNRLDGQTINLLPHLPEEHRFSFIIGSDQLPTLHTWDRYQELLNNLPFYVFPRYGFPNEPFYGNMKLISHKDLVVSNISSTKVRNRIRKGLKIDGFVPGGVAEYIKKHSFYLD